MSVPGHTLSPMTIPFTHQDAADLADRVTGPVLLADDPRLADEARGQFLFLSHSPDITVGAATESDVVEAVRFAIAHDLPVHVQSTGHGTHDHIDRGMLITTRRLDHLHVDPASRTATVGAGLRWRTVADAAAPYDLAPITGSAPAVGVVGFLLGGGLGPLARSHGFGSDWVRSVRLVTGAGELVTASDTENSELFWALRGGKSGFGVVTQVTIELAEIPSLYAGSLTFSAEHIADVLRAWSRWSRDVPDTVTSSVAVIRFPDVEQIPAPMRGATVLSVRVAVPNAAEDAEAIVAPLRETAPAMADDIGPMPLTEMGRIHNDPEDPSPMHAWSSAHLLRTFDDAFLESFIGSFGADGETPLTVVELRHIGTERPAPDTAADGRDGTYLFSALGISPTAQDELYASSLAPFLAEAEQWAAPQTPVNFLADVPIDEVTARAWSAENAERLRAIRAQTNPNGRIVGLR